MGLKFYDGFVMKNKVNDFGDFDFKSVNLKKFKVKMGH